MDVAEVVLDALKEHGVSLLLDIDSFETIINSYSVDLYEECYLIVQGLRQRVLQLLMFERHVTPRAAVDTLHTYTGLDENDALFTFAALSEIVKRVEWDIEVVNLASVYDGAVESDDITAMKLIAMLYYDGVGVPQDYEKAYQLFERLEDLGDDEAYYYLGLMREHGLGVEEDKAMARQYYIRGASLNENECLYKLGMMQYRDGQKDEALETLIESEDPRAYGAVGDILKNQRDFRGAFKAYMNGATQFHGHSLQMVSEGYEYGMGIMKNDEKALMYQAYAYYMRDPEATRALALRFENGEGVKQDHERAVKLIETYERLTKA